MNAQINVTNTASSPGLPPLWECIDICCNLNLANYTKLETPAVVFRQEARELLEKYTDHTKFYTDGSKTMNNVGTAFVSDSNTNSVTLPPLANAFVYLRALCNTKCA